MWVGVFYAQIRERNPRGHDTADAMIRGIEKHGHDVFHRRQDLGYEPCDIAVMWGMEKLRFPDSLCRKKIVEDHGDKPFVRMERGYMCREIYENVGLNGMWGYADYRNENSPPDRFRRLGLEIRPWRHSDGHVLVIGQVPWDTAVQHIDFKDWALKTIKHYEAQGRKVLFRPHPLIDRKMTRTLQEDLEGAALTVAFTSTSAVESLLAGVPTIVHDPQAICWKLCGKDVISEGDTPDREQFFYDLAYTQWTHKEIAEGEAWAHLFRP